MKRSFLLAVSIAVVVAAGSVTWAKTAKDAKDEDWLPGDKLKECLDVAAVKDVPVAILFQLQTTDCPLHKSRVANYELIQHFKSMQRVRAFTESPPAELAEVRRGTFTYVVPVVFIADGEGHTIGYIANETIISEAHKIAKQANDIMAWKRTARAALATLDKQLEEKKLTEPAKLIAAYKGLVLLAQQDLANTKAVRTSVEANSKLSKAAKDQKDTNAGKKVEAEKKEPELPVTEGVFFAVKIKELRSTLDAALTEKLDAIDAQITAGDLQKATAALAPLLPGKFGDAIDERVKALDQKIKTAKKDAGKPKADAEN